MMTTRIQLLLIACACAITAGLGAYVYISHAAGDGSPLPAFADTVEPRHASSSMARIAPAGSKLYASSKYGFSLLYPNSLAVHEYDEGGGAMTITLQNPQDAKGFQIFVVPYSGSQVSEARFKEDEPSGVREGVKTVSIDGASGASFYSTNLALGDTAEVWFIHGGYLYEVTTLKPLSSWLSDILATWQFE